MRAAIPWSSWLIYFQLFCLAMLLLGVLLHKFTLVSFPVAFGSFALALLLLLISLAAALVVLLLTVFGKLNWQLPTLFALVLGVAPLLTIVLVVGPSNFAVPPIHDISTDLDFPPALSAAQQARKPSENSVVHGGERVAALQSSGYPQVQPLLLPLQPSAVFALCLAQVNAYGWTILNTDAGNGIIEAYAETALFGFKDDVVIRVVAEGDGSRVDMRSASRVGQSDFGANARRILDFLARIESAAKT